jgi:hypothetical protein
MWNLLIGLAASSALVAAIIGPAAAAVIPNVGPKADVAAVTATAVKDWHARDFRTDGVHVVGDYALLRWLGGYASGPAVYKRSSGELWKRISFGGGMMYGPDLVRLVQSKSIARQLCSGWPKLYTPCSGF